MGFTYIIDKDNRRITFIAEGEKGVEELIAAIESVMAETEYGPGYDTLIDISRLTPAPSVDNLKMKKLAGFISSMETRIGVSRWAFHAPRFIQYTFTKLLKKMVRSDVIEMRIFRNEADARGWLES